MQGSYEGNEGKKGRKGKREAEKKCMCVYWMCVQNYCMCVLCNAVSSDKGWERLDLATVRPISSPVVWNGSLATVTCKEHPNTETYISALRGFHLACTPTPHQVLWLMNHVSSSVVKKILLWRGSAANPRQVPPQLPSTNTLARIKTFAYLHLEDVPWSGHLTWDFVDVVVRLFSASLIGIPCW